jgi:amidophosphoribosyltransferase
MCGVIGVFGTPYSSQEVQQGLQLLQHRGQDAAGILSFNSQTKNFSLYKDTGLVARVFGDDKLSGVSGDMSIGHTRYATVGPKTAIDAKRDLQPMMVNYPFGIGMVHNGNLVNYYNLKKELKEKHNRILFTQNDLEALLNILSNQLLENKADQQFHFEQFQASVKNLFDQAKGGYSVLGVLGEKGFFAFRDPNGIRPLILGRRTLTEEEKKLNPAHFGVSYCASSETNALNFLGYEVIRDLHPGEIIFIDTSGEIYSSSNYSTQNKIPKRTCMFEYVYFSNPESKLEDVSIYKARLNFGKQIADEVRDKISSGAIKPDIIVPIPETSRVAAISMSENLGIPYREVLIKNRYIQRSFILNTQESRKRAVQLKLTAIADEIKGKNVMLVDDSVVRGTTSKKIIDMVREAGAREVYLVSTCPPIRHPCFYGVDFPDPKELVAHGKDEREIANILGADHVFYLTEESLKKSIGSEYLCMACINGKYPVETSASAFSEMRKADRNG